MLFLTLVVIPKKSETGYKIRKFKVRPGDTLDKLAKHFNTTVKQIRSDNRHYFPVGEAGKFFPRQILIIRDCRTQEDRTELKMVVSLHTVVESDTLESIADTYGVRIADVREKNRSFFPVGEPGNLFPGQILQIVIPKQVPLTPLGEITIHNR